MVDVVNDRDESDAAKALQRAITFHRAGNLVHAERIYRILTPANANVSYLLGTLEVQRGRHQEGIRLIDNALAIRPDHVEALNNRGRALAAMGRWQQCLKTYNRALAIRPDHFAALSNRQRVHWDLRWSNPSILPIWWVDGPHYLIRTTVESGWLSTGCSVLEIGCGAGQGAAWLARQGFAVTGIDISATAINRAQSNFRGQSGLTFCQADATGRNTLNRAFDAIIDSGCLHQLPAEHKPRYLESVLAWSRPQTKFIILVHCIEQTPADRLKQVQTLFTPHFDILSYEYRANVLPRAPEVTHMVFRLIRRGGLLAIARVDEVQPTVMGAAPGTSGRIDGLSIASFGRCWLKNIRLGAHRYRPVEITPLAYVGAQSRQKRSTDHGR
jgi:SAM-dependent methyltransferase